MAEKVLVYDDGRAERRVWHGNGQPAEITEFDTDEMLLEARQLEQEQGSQSRLHKLRHPFRAIRERVIGVLDTSEEVRAEQLAKELGSPTLLARTVEEWRRSEEVDYAA